MPFENFEGPGLVTPFTLTLISIPYFYIFMHWGDNYYQGYSHIFFGTILTLIFCIINFLPVKGFAFIIFAHFVVVVFHRYCHTNNDTRLRLITIPIQILIPGWWFLLKLVLLKHLYRYQYWYWYGTDIDIWYFTI